MTVLLKKTHLTQYSWALAFWLKWWFSSKPMPRHGTPDVSCKASGLFKTYDDCYYDSKEARENWLIDWLIDCQAVSNSKLLVFKITIAGWSTIHYSIIFLLFKSKP